MIVYVRVHAEYMQQSTTVHRQFRHWREADQRKSPDRVMLPYLPMLIAYGPTVAGHWRIHHHLKQTEAFLKDLYLQSIYFPLSCHNLPTPDISLIYCSADLRLGSRWSEVVGPISSLFNFLFNYPMLSSIPPFYFLLCGQTFSRNHDGLFASTIKFLLSTGLYQSSAEWGLWYEITMAPICQRNKLLTIAIHSQSIK